LAFTVDDLRRSHTRMIDLNYAPGDIKEMKRDGQPFARFFFITDPDGFELDNLEVVDLGERHPRRRAWLRTIVTTQDPKLLETKVSAYMMDDRIEVPPKKLDIEEFAKRKARRRRRKNAAQG
ncbi:MAG: hypothetical protein AAFS10_04380, partial [Myxococcota bacterium]